MVKNYFIIALRNIKRHSAYSILNICGMAIGMACAILILLWVQDELSFDRFHKNAADLYRVIQNQHLSNDENSAMVPTPGALASALKKDYPDIIRASRYLLVPLTLKKGDEFIEEMVSAVDKDFLKMFTIQFVCGDINSALDDPHNILITEEIAKKYFGNENALGKTIQSRGYLVKVTGVVKSFPNNSHFRFDFLVPIQWLSELGGPINEWEFGCDTYIELKKGAESNLVYLKIKDFIKKHKNGSNSEIFLQNIKKIHLYSSKKYAYDTSIRGDIIYVRIMGLIAIFILLIACINFMNLSTAQSAKRAKEIGVRKVAGAYKRKIIIQFLGESLFIVCIAHIIAMILVEILLPGYNNLIGKMLIINYHSFGLYIGLIALILFCSLLAGSYSALYLSSLKPLDIIKGVIYKKPVNTQFRRILVVFQFSLSILLILCTLIVRKQVNYMQNKKLGFNRENIGYFMFPIRPNDPKLETLKKELISIPGVTSVTRGEIPVNNEWTWSDLNWNGKKTGEKILFHILGVDEDYAKTFQLELKEGRFFSPEFTTDNTSIVINEEAARIMDFKNPVGEIILTPESSKLSIIGVVKDFHFQSLHFKIEPLIMQKSESNKFMIKMTPDKMASTMAFINKTYKSFDPGLPLNFHFLDNDFDKLYRSEQRMNKIFSYFSFLAILISCLGLIGLSSFMTERRTKEIGIRKANGAKSIEIFILLSKEYIIWVSISIIIACPIAWFAMNNWLQNFAYRVGLNYWVFIVVSISSLFIALLTVSIQSYNAANKNPVKALRYE